jgi:hypothetical protein
MASPRTFTSPNANKVLKVLKVLLVLMVPAALAACDSDSPMGPGNATMTTVRFVYAGPTAARTDLPASAQACVNGVGQTHIHPSWREFQAFALTAVPPSRYEITLNDVPIGTQVSFRINDRNWCDVNPTGAVLRDVSANDVALVQNTLTPGSGQEPGYAFTVSQDGRITQ